MHCTLIPMATETHKHEEVVVEDLSQNPTQGEEEELQMVQGQRINNQMSACFLGMRRAQLQHLGHAKGLKSYQQPAHH